MPNETRTRHVAETNRFYATKPTHTTVFMRTFLPWQLWRFAVINMKMLAMIRTSHSSRNSH